MRFGRKIVISGVVLLLVGVLSCSNPSPHVVDLDTSVPTATHETSAVESNLEAGKAVYKQICITCHGAKGDLQLNGASNLRTSTLSQDERVQVIANGRKTMLAYKSMFSAAQIEAVAAYTLSLTQK